MPDAPVEAVTKKVGPLPIWAYGVIAVGAYFVYEHYKNTQAANAAVANAGTVPAINNAPVSPTDTSGIGVSSSSPTDWLSQAESALSNLGYSSSVSQPALQNYFAGQTLTPQEYNAIESVVKLIGQAPGISLPTQGSGPTPSIGSGPPALSAALLATMRKNGEALTSFAYSSVDNTWYYLTSKGGVYNAKTGGGIRGSIFSLTPAQKAANPALANPGIWNHILVNPSTGQYTLYSTNGAEQTF